MIQLHPDYFILQRDFGELIPCSAETIALEIKLHTDSDLDPEWIRQAALAVLHYFKHDLEKTFVTIDEFSSALKRVICSLDQIKNQSSHSRGPTQSTDLKSIAVQTGVGFELIFFNRLREEFTLRLGDNPKLLLFERLRDCVKQLLGVSRWTRKCQALGDQIVYFLRRCFEVDSHPADCSLVIR